jgi:hypothetical protein
MATLYIASKSSNHQFALESGNIIAVCYSGPDPETDARSYAYDFTREEEKSSFVYKAEIVLAGGYKIAKEVVSFGPTGA